MSDSTTLEETGEEQLPELVESDHLGAGGTAEDTPIKARLLLPILVPAVAIVIVAFLVLNISRVFLAGDKDAALAMGITITLAILVGATIIAAAPRLKTSTLAVILGSVFVVVSIAGLVSLGHSLDEGSEGGGFQYSTKPATGSVDVNALSTLKFNATEFTAKGPVVQINYGGASGHTLAIQDPKFAGFLLTTDAGGKKSGKVDIPPGSYTIYCTVPGHEAAGMKATLTVTG